MNKQFTLVILIGALCAVPAIGLAAPGSQAATTHHKAKAAATHATSGVIKSVDGDTLVITRGKNADMTFMLNSSTHREGAISAGNPVSVRYQTEGSTYTATAVTAHQAKKTSSTAASKK